MQPPSWFVIAEPRDGGTFASPTFTITNGPHTGKAFLVVFTSVDKAKLFIKATGLSTDCKVRNPTHQQLLEWLRTYLLEGVAAIAIDPVSLDGVKAVSILDFLAEAEGE
jgi:hypothetical protein